MKYKAVIFDMDGTILNTLDDLTDSLNYALAKFGHKADYTVNEVRMFFGSGIHVAIERALATENGFPQDRLELIGTLQQPDLGLEECEIQKVMEVYLPYYAEHCNEKTGAYPGIMDLVRQLKQAGIVTAVVSNKPDEAVQSLCIDYFDGIFDYSVGELPEIQRKPAPDMTEKALKYLQIEKKDAVYIGDSEVDIQTAVNSGLDYISVDWGFRTREFLEKQKSKCIVSDCKQIADIVLN